MNDAQTQAKAIREQLDKHPRPAPETPREARLRTQIEQERKRTPMTGGVK